MSEKTENLVLCGANSYEQKYYLNEAFAKLPQSIKEELQIAGLKIRQMQREKRELLESLELYYRVFFLGEKADV